jgi:hypothetical protein
MVNACMMTSYPVTDADRTGEILFPVEEKTDQVSTAIAFVVKGYFNITMRAINFPYLSLLQVNMHGNPAFVAIDRAQGDEALFIFPSDFEDNPIKAVKNGFWADEVVAIRTIA